MPNTVLGKVSCVPRGDYSASETYYALDIVGYQGGSYLAMKEVTGIEPSNDGVNWMQLSGPGLPGEQGEKGDPGTAAGFGEATATVDETTGTPSVEVETSGPDTAKVFSFSFSGLKGETGAKGDTGDQGIQGIPGVAAGFGTPTATVDDTVGTPGVTVQASGPDTAKVFSFAFVNLKGETGEQGIQGEKGDPGTSVQSIQRTSGTGAAGTTDTYTMYDSDGGEIGTFTVYNGSNGTGSGDFMANGTVPMTGALVMGGNKITNMADPTADTDGATKGYVDEALKGVSITTDATPTADSTNPVQSGGVYNALQGKQNTLSGTEDQLVGFNAAGDAVAVSKPTPADIGAVPVADVGVADGIAELDSTGKVPASQLPEMDYIPTSEKGAASGVATLDTTGKLTEAQKPTYTASDVGAIASPSGGTTGQVLTKTADGSEWSDAPSGLPDGGTEGQVLTKGESGPEWGDKPVMYVNVTSDDSSGYTADKTMAEIYQAYQAGYSIFAFVVNCYVLPLTVMQYPNTISFSTQIGASTITASFGQGILNVQIDDMSASVVSFTPGDTGLTSDNVQDAIEEVNAKIPAKPKAVSVTLPSTGWASNSQTVTVQGVETSGQSVRISPATKTDADNWVAAGVWCSEPTTVNQLVFTCDTAPTEDININVELQEVQS